ncbi:Phosphatidylinositol transfer protein SEC14 and related proteins [Phaffia rhodozyma]|uniref:Phosphatidylinositol transfer protein SEC14 and related proteins n=1 Tax=Phaffia rhodozyma TaxID=264483 RepID=A0A0F7SIF2_PHARH|nr:Phosphatidylinositol transfer protein SEC14 and related proteins [Phaffia rhodozyma]
MTHATASELSGHVGHLSPEQETALIQFRSNLIAAGLCPVDPFAPEVVANGPGYNRYDDATLLRFLRARKFDLVKAQEMWKANEEWRKSYGTDQLWKTFDYPTGEEKATIEKYYPQYYHKMDKDGRPVYVEVLGQLDMNKLFAATTQERMIKCLVYEYEKLFRERLPACQAVVGHTVETSCTILDLNNVGLSNFYKVKNYVGEASTIGQNYYPETMGKFFIINSPYLFSGVWSLVKPWLDEVTVRKISIPGRDWKTQLLAQVPAENLEVKFGGKSTEPASSDAGPWNTESGRQAVAAAHGPYSSTH